MKRFSLFLALVLVPRTCFAQPNAKPQDAPAPPSPILFAFNSEANRRGMALMGAFYNSIQNAKSYQGHFVLAQNSIQNGKVTQTKSLDMDSTWKKDDNGGLLKVRSEGAYIVTENDKTTTDQIFNIDDGQKSSFYYETRKAWKERPQVKSNSSDYSPITSLLPWSSTMLLAAIASDLTVETQGATTVVSSTDKNYQAVFNANGTLQSWKQKSRDGATETTIVFDRLELNAPIPDNVFTFQIPQGVKQVGPDEAKDSFSFSLGY